MNIGIEATKIHNKDGGFGVYPKKLIENILKQDRINQFFIFTSEIIEDFNKYNNCSQIYVSSSDGKIGNLKLYFTFKNIVKKYKISFLHLLSLYGIYNTPVLTVSTVFDLRYLVVSELKDLKFGTLIYKYWLPHLLKQNNHLISISEETKKCLIKHYNIPVEKITVVPLGYDNKFNTFSLTDNKQDYFPEKYFIWVGQITNRKNLGVLYKAFRRFIQNSLFKDFKLIIVGRFLNYKIENIHKEKIATLGIKNSVIFTGYISEIKLISLYKKAKAFIFPSIYEGFGIPIIEAMALGVPVITTIDGGATKEVAGDSALFFSKYDHYALSKRMFEIVNNDKLRNHLITKSKIRAEMYTWEKTAHLTLFLYNKLIKKLSCKDKKN